MATVLCSAKPLVTALAVMSGLASAPPSMALRNIKVGDPMPAFSVEGLDGTKISNATYQGKVLLLVFVRPKHDKSLRALRVAQRVMNERRDAKFAVLAVSTKPGTEQHFKGVASELGLTYPVAIDPGRRLYGAVGLIVAPTTLLIDERGLLRFELPHMPPSYDRKLRTHTDLLLGTITRQQHDERLAQKDESAGAGQDSWTRRLRLAQALVEQRKFEQAISILRKLHAEKDTEAVSALLGSSLLDVDRTEEAARYLEPLAKAKASSPRAKLALGRLEMACGNYGTAEKFLQDTLLLSPDKGPIFYYLGLMYERRGELPKAVDCYRRALELVYGIPGDSSRHDAGSDVAAEPAHQGAGAPPP